MVALLLVVFINFVGIGALIPVIPYTIVAELGYSETVMSALLASFSLAMFISNPILGRLSDRFGRNKLLIVSIGIMVAGNFWFAMSNDIVSLFAARILAGIGSGNIGIVQAMLVARSKTEDRAKSMGLMGAAIGAGFVLGPALGGLLSGIGSGPLHQTPFLIASLFGILAILLCLRLPKAPAMPEKAVSAGSDNSTPETVSVFARLRKTLLGTIGWFALAFFLLNLSFAQVEASFVLLMKDMLDFSSRDTGWMFTYIGVCIVLVQGGLIGRVVKRFGEMPTILIGSSLLLTGQIFTIGFSLAASYIPISLLLQIIGITTMICVGFALTNPTLSAASSRVARSADMGGALGLVQGFGSLGQVFGLLLAGPLYQLGGGAANYGFAAVITAGLIITVLLLAQVKDEVDAVS